ncbi:unannotated protein [freshwater metagenome]|uniref:Unannotated protein n=1 Tax=freshwater metagenome TaxID=449393 RepID=A0A6J6NID2_9ZZZZ
MPPAAIVRAVMSICWLSAPQTITATQHTNHGS